MKNIFKTFGILSTLCFLTGCQLNDSAISDDFYFLKPIRQVKFPLDNSTSYMAMFLGVIGEKNNPELMFLNHKKPSVIIFDINTKTLKKEINLTKDGPNGVDSPTGLLVKSADSIFVISSSHYTVSLVNQKGQKLKYFKLLNGNYGENTGMIRPYTISPPILFKEKIYFNVAPDRDVYKPSYYDGYTNSVLDINSGEYKYFNTFPKEFKKGVWGVASINFSTAFNQKEFVYSFAISDSIEVFDPDKLSRKKYYAASRFKEKITPMPIAENSRDLEYALQTPYYSTIVYDPYEKVYYRFIKHSIDVIDQKTGEKNQFFEKPLSVIILNENFKIIGETKLENNRFLDHLFFITKDGLFISENNPENPDLVEDFAVFQCFKLTKK